MIVVRSKPPKQIAEFLVAHGGSHHRQSTPQPSIVPSTTPTVGSQSDEIGSELPAAITSPNTATVPISSPTVEVNNPGGSPFWLGELSFVLLVAIPICLFLLKR